MFNQFEGPHHPYIMGYENYGPLPPSPYMINGINHHINPWNEFSELHSDPVNVTDLMHPIQMMPMVSNENINMSNLDNIGLHGAGGDNTMYHQYYVGSSNDFKYQSQKRQQQQQQQQQQRTKEKKKKYVQITTRPFVTINNLAPL